MRKKRKEKDEKKGGRRTQDEIHLREEHREEVWKQMK